MQKFIHMSRASPQGNTKECRLLCSSGLCIRTLVKENDMAASAALCTDGPYNQRNTGMIQCWQSTQPVSYLSVPLHSMNSDSRFIKGHRAGCYHTFRTSWNGSWTHWRLVGCTFLPRPTHGCDLYTTDRIDPSVDVSPITGIGAGGNSCAAQLSYCTSNNFVGNFYSITSAIHLNISSG